MAKPTRRIARDYEHMWVYRKHGEYQRSHFYVDSGGIEMIRNEDAVAYIVLVKHMNYTFRQLVHRMEKRNRFLLDYQGFVWLRSAVFVVWINGDISRDDCLRLASTPITLFQFA